MYFRLSKNYIFHLSYFASSLDMSGAIQLSHVSLDENRSLLNETVSSASFAHRLCMDKRKGFPYSIPSVGPGADPGVQAVSLQVTV